jgi:hypothetical protein
MVSLDLKLNLQQYWLTQPSPHKMLTLQEWSRLDTQLLANMPTILKLEFVERVNEALGSKTYLLNA